MNENVEETLSAETLSELQEKMAEVEEWFEEQAPSVRRPMQLVNLTRPPPRSAPLAPLPPLAPAAVAMVRPLPPVPGAAGMAFQASVLRVLAALGPYMAPRLVERVTPEALRGQDDVDLLSMFRRLRAEILRRNLPLPRP